MSYYNNRPSAAAPMSASEWRLMKEDNSKKKKKEKPSSDDDSSSDSDSDSSDGSTLSAYMKKQSKKKKKRSKKSKKPKKYKKKKQSSDSDNGGKKGKGKKGGNSSSKKGEWVPPPMVGADLVGTGTKTQSKYEIFQLNSKINSHMLPEKYDTKINLDFGMKIALLHQANEDTGPLNSFVICRTMDYDLTMAFACHLLTCSVDEKKNWTKKLDSLAQDEELRFNVVREDFFTKHVTGKLPLTDEQITAIKDRKDKETTIIKGENAAEVKTKKAQAAKEKAEAKKNKAKQAADAAEKAALDAKTAEEKSTHTIIDPRGNRKRKTLAEMQELLSANSKEIYNSRNGSASTNNTNTINGVEYDGVFYTWEEYKAWFMGTGTKDNEDDFHSDSDSDKKKDISDEVVGANGGGA